MIIKDYEEVEYVNRKTLWSKKINIDIGFYVLNYLLLRLNRLNIFDYVAEILWFSGLKSNITGNIHKNWRAGTSKTLQNCRFKKH